MCVCVCLCGIVRVFKCVCVCVYMRLCEHVRLCIFILVSVPRYMYEHACFVFMVKSGRAPLRSRSNLLQYYPGESVVLSGRFLALNAISKCKFGCK